MEVEVEVELVLLAAIMPALVLVLREALVLAAV